jgi:sigma-E factor negative regulatory protein RseB
MKISMHKALGFWCLLVLSAASSAMEWKQLDSMRIAIQELNYRGEFLHRRGDDTSVYSIVHQYKNQQSTELLQQLDGDMVEVLRQGDRMVCYYPEGSEEAINHAVPAAPFSQVGELELDRIATNYKAMKVGQARVAGYQTNIIELTGDGWRFRQKFWLEQQTNLLLQSELIDLNGEVLEQFRFTRIELGVDITEKELVPSLEGDVNARQQSAFKTTQTMADDSEFLSQLQWLPSGYELTHTSQKTDANGWLEQRTFSDGLTSFSVFVESGQSSVNQSSALAKMGATTALMTAKNDLAITVIGEIPDKTAKQIAQMLSERVSSL